jgi:putative ABC transport system permease protein
VLGTTIRLDGAVAAIVGVLPAWFDARTPVSVPLRLSVAEFARRGTGRVSVEARLRPGITVEDAAARLTARLPRSNGPGAPVRVVVTSQLEDVTSRYRTTINVFIGAVALIVAMAVVNVAGLLLARGTARQRELDVRASLGASRARVMRQLVTESLVLAIPAGAIGVVLAWLSLDAIVVNIPLSLPSNSPVTLNLTVLAATAGLLLITAVACGWWPAIRVSRANAGRVMQGHRQVGSAFSRRSGQLLIGAEIALAVVDSSDTSRKNRPGGNPAHRIKAGNRQPAGRPAGRKGVGPVFSFCVPQKRGLFTHSRSHGAAEYGDR